jgi:hypothetical protein
MPFIIDNGRKSKPINPGEEVSMNLEGRDVGVLAIDADSPRKIHITLLDKNLGITLDETREFIKGDSVESKRFKIRYRDGKQKAALRVTYIPDEDEITLS